MNEIQQLVLIGGAAGGGKAAAELVKEFLLMLLGPTLNEAGRLLASPIASLNQRRAARAAMLLQNGAQQLIDAGIEPQPVPDYLLLPLLSHGSLIDDADLQSVWAQLLASAATQPDTVWPSFPQILSELSAREALFLSGLVHGREIEWYERGGFRVDLHYRDGKLNQKPERDQQVIVENLIRLGLLRQEAPKIEVSKQKMAEMVTRLERGDFHFPIRLDEQLWGPEYSITALGVAFMVACSGPGGIQIKERPKDTALDL